MGVGRVVRKAAAAGEHHKGAAAGDHRELVAGRDAGRNSGGSSGEAEKPQLDADQAEAVDAETTAAVADGGGDQQRDLAVDAEQEDTEQGAAAHTVGAGVVAAAGGCSHRLDEAGAGSRVGQQAGDYDRGPLCPLLNRILLDLTGYCSGMQDIGGSR